MQLSKQLYVDRTHKEQQIGLTFHLLRLTVLWLHAERVCRHGLLPIGVIGSQQVDPVQCEGARRPQGAEGGRFRPVVCDCQGAKDWPRIRLSRLTS
jgi:hypothetical protein